MGEQASSGSIVEQALVPMTADRPVPTRAQTARFGDFVVAFVEHGPVVVGRDSTVYRRARSTSRLLIVLAGRVELSRGGFQATLDRRDCALVRGPVRVEYRSDRPSAVLLCDRLAADAGVAPLPSSVPFVVGRASAVVPSALGAFLLDLLKQDTRRFSAEVRREVTDILQAVVPPIIAGLEMAGYSEYDRGRQRIAAKRYIAQRYTDPDLNQATVAAHLGISVRGLQRLFADEDRSVSQHIHRARTRHAVARLGDRRYDTMPVGDIARLSGFGSVAAMRRAIQEQTGLTPNDLRRRPPGTPRDLEDPAPGCRGSASPPRGGRTELS